MKKPEKYPRWFKNWESDDKTASVPRYTIRTLLELAFDDGRKKGKREAAATGKNLFKRVF